jgi:hypothetical protein
MADEKKVVDAEAAAEKAAPEKDAPKKAAPKKAAPKKAAPKKAAVKARKAGMLRRNLPPRKPRQKRATTNMRQGSSFNTGTKSPGN